MEKRQKMELLGIVDDEEIMRMKREKDLYLKDKFSLETFEFKYEKELRQRNEKKRRMEEEKVKKEQDLCTF